MEEKLSDIMGQLVKGKYITIKTVEINEEVFVKSRIYIDNEGFKIDTVEDFNISTKFKAFNISDKKALELLLSVVNNKE